MTAELFGAAGTPDQVVVLLRSRLFHGAADIVGAGRQCLALIERLGADLAAVVDPHQPRRLPAFGIGQLGLGNGFCGIGPAGRDRVAQQGAQADVELDQEVVEWRILALYGHEVASWYACWNLTPWPGGPAAGSRGPAALQKWRRQRYSCCAAALTQDDDTDDVIAP